MDITTVGIDIAKNIFQLHGVNDKGQVVLTQRVSRHRLLATLANNSLLVRNIRLALHVI